MKITIIAVGKLKQKQVKELCDDYKKRLSLYCSLNIMEVADEDCDADMNRALKIEAENIKSKIPQNSYKILCHIKGEKLSSDKLSLKMNDLFVSGISHLCFIVGGSCGVNEEIESLADMKLSFSDMTFPHGLFRVMLLEQIYRSFKIIKNEPYHK